MHQISKSTYTDPSSSILFQHSMLHSIFKLTTVSQYCLYAYTHAVYMLHVKVTSLQYTAANTNPHGVYPLIHVRETTGEKEHNQLSFTSL